jgi:hypothetical protein
MPNESIKFLNIIKQAAIDAVQEGVTANFVYGIVTATDPLEIQLESKLPIPADNLVLTKNTCMWSVDMDVDHQTEDASGGSGDAEYESHHHGYKGCKTFLVHNELAVGDKVILARCEGGQRFIVLDRVYNPDRGCSG